MFKSLVVGSVLLVSLALAPVARADDQVCTSVYGGGVICGAKTEHEPVATDLADIDPRLFGSGLLGLSLVLRGAAKKMKAKLLASDY